MAMYEIPVLRHSNWHSQSDIEIKRFYRMIYIYLVHDWLLYYKFLSLKIWLAFQCVVFVRIEF